MLRKDTSFELCYFFVHFDLSRQGKQARAGKGCMLLEEVVLHLFVPRREVGMRMF